MNKASGGDGIPVELFQILKDDAVKVLHSIWQQIRKTQQWPQDWKRSVFIPIPKKGNAKECSNYCTITFISHASKVMFKILQTRLQQYVNHELPDGQAGFRTGRGTRDQIANIRWIMENFEHYFTSMWDECNCAVVWAFFGIIFLWDWNEKQPFPVLWWPLLSFPNWLAYWVQHFHSIIF